MPKTHIIIVAAGKGSRFGAELPKQFCNLGDIPVLMHTAISLGRALPQAKMCIVLHPDYADLWQTMCLQHGFVSPRVINGGDTRWASVRNAIMEIDPADDDIVMIHDGVRPVINAEMLHNITKAMSTHRAAVPTIPVTDTLRKLTPDGQSKAFDRHSVMAVQTPQAFHGQEIKRAYMLPYDETFTDDASVYEAAGYPPPALVNGSVLNIKITHPKDLEVAALFMGIK